MTYNITLLKHARKDFDKLPSSIKPRIAQALREIQDFPEATSRAYKLHKPLTGYKRRVGKYRILFDINKKDLEVRAIRKRDKAYKK